MSFLDIEKQLENISIQIAKGKELNDVKRSLFFPISEKSYKILYFSIYDTNLNIINSFIERAKHILKNIDFITNEKVVTEDRFQVITEKIVNFIKNKFTCNDLKLEFRNINFSFEHEHIVWHSLNVAVISYLLGIKLNYSEENLTQLIIAAFFHDIGKLKIKGKLLNKKGVLSKLEFDEIKNHAIYSKQMLNHLNNLDKKTLEAIISHHEKLDGSGYPRGICEGEINEISKIICIADIFEAMISDRAYREGFSKERIFAMMDEETFGKLDKNIVNKLKLVIT